MLDPCSQSMQGLAEAAGVPTYILGQEEMASNCAREGLGWVLWKTLSQKGWPGGGTVCPVVESPFLDVMWMWQLGR